MPSFFTVDGDAMILLHGFKKKSKKTPKKEIDIDENRLKNYKERNK
ncbi:MAG: type II toxin-antitoxin system RelE/ParE family toxin [Treponema sp.]|nr:type II toxin-antitoxin system RelE/ParE family toxin [Treponema sp.]